ncbi:MAG: hypothetical protein ACO1RX_08425 [Candidatus Sericytochromatia bacterium]
MSSIDAYSLVDDAPANVYVYRERVLDSYVTGLVRNLPVPAPSYFAIENAHLFREQFRRRKRLFVLVERRGTDQPAEARVRCVDGSVIVLESPLSFTPQEGACVQLLLGYTRKFVDIRQAEKLEKEAIVWI